MAVIKFVPLSLASPTQCLDQLHYRVRGEGEALCLAPSVDTGRLSSRRLQFKTTLCLVVISTTRGRHSLTPTYHYQHTARGDPKARAPFMHSWCICVAIAESVSIKFVASHGTFEAFAFIILSTITILVKWS